MRTSWPAVALALLGGGCGASADEVDALRKDMVRLRAESREARKEAARAREEVSALNLRAEIHAFLQSDKALLGDGRFNALRSRVLGDSRSYTFLLSSSDTARMPHPLYFKSGERIRVDFVAGSGAANESGNRLEVFTRTESFTPLSVKPNQYNAYVLEDGQALELRTTAGSGGSSSASRGKRKGRGGVVRNLAEILMRYLPSGGPDPRRVAYVRVSFLGAAEKGEDDDEEEEEDDEEEEEGDSGAKSGGGKSDGEDDDSFDFSVDE